MNKKKYWILALVCAVSVALVLSAYVWASADEEQEEKIIRDARERTYMNQHMRLAGLKRVCISTDVWSPTKSQTQKIENCGLTEEWLQSFAELQLRRYGIKLLTPDSWIIAPNQGRPDLIISVELHELVQVDVWYIHTKITLIEDAFLKRDITIQTFGLTWEKNDSVYATSDKLKNVVKDSLEDMLVKYCNDYLAANPKEPEKKQGKNSIYD